MLVRAQGLANSGERYQLTCSVTSNNGIAPMITWINSGLVLASNGSGLSLEPQITNGITSSSVLYFDPLSMGHDGNYTCQATLRAMSYSYTYTVIVIASE